MEKKNINEDFVGSMTGAKNVLSFLFTLLTMARFATQAKEDAFLTKTTNTVFNQYWRSQYPTASFTIKIIPTATINAFVSPLSFILSPGKITVFLYGGLVNLVGRDSRDLIAIILHEIGHVLKNHLVIHTYLAAGGSLGISALIKWASSLTIDSKLKTFLIGALIVMSQLTVMASTAFISRCLERQADEFAINTGYGKDLANALDKMQKFGTYSQIESKCGIICKTVKSIDTALASHPETKDRVQTILSKTETLKALQKMDKGGIARIAMQEMKDYSWQYAAHKHTINE